MRKGKRSMDLKLLKETWKLRTFGVLKIPLVFYCAPRVVEISDEAVEIVIPLNYRTKNHLGSMYFGVQAVGADVSGGLLAMNRILETGNRVNLVFKDFRAEFLKRPEGDVHFRSTDGAKVRALVDRALASGERENATVEIVATCPSKLGAEPVGRYFLTISLKRKRDSKS
jgi:acyl-coenzyme A thioesterase PaaI-like protein